MKECFYCGTGVNPADVNVAQRITGWELRGRGATRKGGSDITLRESVEEYACNPCIQRKRLGLSPSQESLVL